jgi:hypothetical protein
MDGTQLKKLKPRRCSGAQLPLRYIERRITRDARIPLTDEDRDMEYGWRCIPIPPTDEDGWFVVDDSSDRKTMWGRWRDLFSRGAA